MGTTEDEMAGWHDQLDGRELEQTLSRTLHLLKQTPYPSDTNSDAPPAAPSAFYDTLSDVGSHGKL